MRLYGFISWLATTVLLGGPWVLWCWMGVRMLGLSTSVLGSLLFGAGTSIVGFVVGAFTAVAWLDRDGSLVRLVRQRSLGGNC